MRSRRETLPWWARVADAATIALLVLSAFVALEGGFVLWPAGVRVSIRSEWRVLLWAVVLFGARHVFARDAPLHQRLAVAFSHLLRSGGPLRDDDIAPAPLTNPGTARRRTRLLACLRQCAAVVALFAALTAAMTYPQMRVMGEAVSLNEGDPLFSTWRLAWIAHQLPRDPLNLFNANIFHPEPGTLAFSDAMIVPALMAAPLLWLGVPQLVVYNLIFLSAFALSGAAMFLLVRSLTGRTGAALLAGFIFAFLPYRFMHYPHLELQMAQWMPLCLWAFHRTVTHGRLLDGLLTGLFLALQSLSSWYYGIFLCTFMVPVGVALLIGPRARLFPAVRALAAGAALSTLLIIPMAMPYFAARANVGERPESEIRFYSATARNYLAAHPQNVLFGEHTAHLGGQERELFMGFAVPLLALVALWPPLSAARIAYALGLLLAFEVSLGFNGMLYPWLHEHVLPYRGLRVPARMAMLVGFGLAVLAGYGAARITNLLPRRHAAAAAAILALAVAAEYYSVPMLKTVWTRPPGIYDALPKQAEPNVLLELPLLRPDISLEPLYMYFSTFHWSRLVNGYSGFSPPSYERLWEHLRHFPDDVSIAELRRRGTTHIVVHGALFGRPVEYDELVLRLDSCVELEHVADVRWHGRSTRLYRLLPPLSTVSVPSTRLR